MEKENPQATDITEKRSRKAMRNESATVSFDEGSVITGEKRYTDWKVGWKKLKKTLSEGQKRNKQQSLAEKELQSEIPKQYGEDDFGWLKCHIINICTTGADDRNKSGEEDQGIGG